MKEQFQIFVITGLFAFNKVEQQKDFYLFQAIKLERCCHFSGFIV